MNVLASLDGVTIAGTTYEVCKLQKGALHLTNAKHLLEMGVEHIEKLGIMGGRVSQVRGGRRGERWRDSHRMQNPT